MLNKLNAAHRVLPYRLVSPLQSRRQYSNNNARVPVVLPNAALLKLVKSHQFAAADRLHMHMSNVGIQIDPHSTYEKAATYALINHAANASTSQTRIESFARWFNHIPCKHETTKALIFVRLRELIFCSGTPAKDLHIAMQFALSCAHKGYAEVVMNDAIFLVQRFSDPIAGAEFFFRFETEALGYARRYQDVLGAREARRIDSIFQGIAVAACLEADWVNEAVDLLQSMWESVPRGIIDSVLERLRKEGREHLLIARLVEREEHKRSDTSPPSTSDGS